MKNGTSKMRKMVILLAVVMPDTAQCCLASLHRQFVYDELNTHPSPAKHANKRQWKKEKVGTLTFRKRRRAFGRIRFAWLPQTVPIFGYCPLFQCRRTNRSRCSRRRTFCPRPP